MADDPKRMPQMNVRVDEDLRRQAIEIAKLRDERDLIGTGLSVVMRKALADYVRRHKGLLDDAHDTRLDT